MVSSNLEGKVGVVVVEGVEEVEEGEKTVLEEEDQVVSQAGSALPAEIIAAIRESVLLKEVRRR